MAFDLSNVDGMTTREMMYFPEYWEAAFKFRVTHDPETGLSSGYYLSPDAEGFRFGTDTRLVGDVISQLAAQIAREKLKARCKANA